jgi:hypothetical protein
LRILATTHRAHRRAQKNLCRSTGLTASVSQRRRHTLGTGAAQSVCSALRVAHKPPVRRERVHETRKCLAQAPEQVVVLHASLAGAPSERVKCRRQVPTSRLGPFQLNEQCEDGRSSWAMWQRFRHSTNPHARHCGLNQRRVHKYFSRVHAAAVS